jgi:hypothetical protein
MTSRLNAKEFLRVEKILPTKIPCIYGWTLDVSLPHFSTANGAMPSKALQSLNNEINNKWQSWSRKLHQEPVDLASVRESVQRRLEEDRTIATVAGIEIIPREDVLFEELSTAMFNVRYEVWFPYNSLVSVLFHVSQDNPQTWPRTWNEYLTFDLESGKVVDFEGLFQDVDAALLYLSQHCQESLKPSMALEDTDIFKARLELSLENTGDLKAPATLTDLLYRHWDEVGEGETVADQERLLSAWYALRAANFLNGISPNRVNFVNFYLKDDVIVFGFSREQIDAPAMRGPLEVQISLSEISHLLKPNFQIG